MLLETYFKHWISILETPERCPALEQFLFFYFDPSSEHSTGHTGHGDATSHLSGIDATPGDQGGDVGEPRPTIGQQRWTQSTS